MREYFYLVFGFALLRLLYGERRGELERPWAGPARKQKGRSEGVLKFYLGVLLALALLVAWDGLTSYFLWKPSGRGDFRTLSLFLIAYLLAGRREISFFILLAGMALWVTGEQGVLPPEKSLLGGAGLAAGTAALEGLLKSLQEHLRLSSLPPVMKGETLLFWLASLLFLAVAGIARVAAHL